MLLSPIFPFFRGREFFSPPPSGSDKGDRAIPKPGLNKWNKRRKKKETNEREKNHPNKMNQRFPANLPN